MLERKKYELTQPFIKNILHYNEETGEFTWLVKRPPDIKPGQKAGYLLKTGYIFIGIGGHRILAHRLAYFYMNGTWPWGEMDHINGIRTDNRWSNLRAASRLDNGRNLKLRHDNTSGYRGVSWMAKKGKWRARLFVDGKERHLGLFATKEAAIGARMKAAVELHGEFFSARSH